MCGTVKEPDETPFECETIFDGEPDESYIGEHYPKEEDSDE